MLALSLGHSLVLLGGAQVAIASGNGTRTVGRGALDLANLLLLGELVADGHVLEGVIVV